MKSKKLQQKVQKKPTKPTITISFIPGFIESGFNSVPARNVSIMATIPVQNFNQSESNNNLSVKLSLNAIKPTKQPVIISINAIDIFNRFATTVDKIAKKNLKAAIE